MIFPSGTNGDENYIRFKDHSGNRYRFFANSNGTYTPYGGVTATLVKNNTTPATYTIVDTDQTIYNFDENGRLQILTDASGKAFTYSYTTNGKLDRVTSAGDSRYLQFAYNNAGNLETVSDSSNRSVSFTIDNTGNLTASTDLLGRTWTYEYNANHALTRALDPNSKVIVRNEYSIIAGQFGRITKQFNGNGDLVMELSYQADGTVQVKNALSQIETNTYNSLGTLTGDQNISGDTTSKTYDDNFRPTTITDARNNHTNLSWSNDGADLTNILDADGKSTSITYIDHKAHTITDPNQNTTTYNYTGNLLTSIVAGGKTALYTYYTQSPRQGLLETVTDPGGQVTKYEYDTHGQRTKLIVNYSPNHAENEAGLYNLTTTYQYDDLGRITDVAIPTGKSNPAWLVTHNENDDAGHLILSIQNYNSDVENFPQNFQDLYNITTRYYYNVRGKQIATMDTYGAITRTYYDDADRAITVVRNLAVGNRTIAAAIADENIPVRGSGGPGFNLRTDNGFDDAGNLISTTDEKGIITRTSYDWAERRVTVVRNLTGQGIYSPTNPDENVTSQTISDPNGNVIATIDNSGVITRTYYDSLNRPSLVVENLTGQAISIATPPTCGEGNTNLCTNTFYDNNGNVIATQDSLGKITRTYYDSLNRPIRVVQNLVGQGYQVTWLDNASCGQIDADGNISINLCTDTFYDDAGRVIATQDPQGHITRTWFDAAGRAVTVVRNLIIGQGQDIFTITPPGRESGEPDENIRIDTEYDASGQAVLKTDPLGRQTEYVYDLLGHLSQTIVNPLDGHVQNYHDTATGEYYNLITTTGYDALGRTLTTTDTSNRVTSTQYDNQTGLTLSSTQYGLQTTYSYDNFGQQIAVTDPQGHTTRSYFDSLGRTQIIVRNLTNWSIYNPAPPDGQTSSEINLRAETVYSDNGQVLKTIAEDGKVTEYGYDALGRQTSLKTPLAPARHSAYDALGRLVDATASNGVVTHYGYDAIGRLTDVWENYQQGITADTKTNVHTQYTYDANGNRLSIKDGNGHLTAFTYDRLGHLKTETDALGHSWAYTYDKNGSRVSMLDANQATTGYTYDSQGHLTAIDYPGTDIDVTFSYDVLGRHTGMSDALGQTTWNDYNNLNLPASITDPFGKTVGYGYDTLGNRNSLTYPISTENPSGKVVSYDLDPLRRINAVLDGQLSIAGYQYNLAGQLETVTLGNGVTGHYIYNDAGQLASITHRKGEQELGSYQYPIYDDAGNRKQAVEDMHLSSESTATPTVTETATPTGTSTLTAIVTIPPTDTTTATPMATPTGTSTLTATVTVPPTYTATATPTVTATPTITYTPTSTQSASDLLFADGFESGDLSAWLGADTDGGDLSVSTQAAGIGTYGLKAVINDAAEIGAYDGSPTSETHISSRFYINTNSINIASPIVVWQGSWKVYVELSQDGPYYRFRTCVHDNAGHAPCSRWVNTNNGWNAIEVEWQAASATGANNGFVNLKVNNVLAAAMINLNTDAQQIDTIQIGGMGSTAGSLGTLYFDAYETHRGSAIGLAAGGPAAQAPLTNIVMVDGFDKGDTSAWESVDDVSGGLSITASAAHVGGFGMQTTLNPNNSVVLYDDSPDAESYFRARFDLNPNGATIPSDLTLWDAERNGWKAWLTFQSSGSNYQYKLCAKNDADFSNCGSLISTTNGWQTIQVEWQAASAPGANDGFVKFSLNGTLVSTISNLDSDTLRIEWAALGAMNIPMGSSGTMYFDSYESYRAPAGSGGGALIPSDGSELIAPPATSSSYVPQQGSFQVAAYRPNIPAAPATKTKTPTPILPTATRTNTPLPPTSTSTITPVPATPTTTATPTGTSTLTATVVPPTYTATATPTVSATPPITNTPTNTATVTATPTQAATATPTLMPIPSGPATIDYSYDPLNRLASATYSNGITYEYTYDAVGNRKSQTITINGTATTILYEYDDANRLTSVNGVAYTYDDNGNLLSDGTNTYTYDSANRLKSVTSISNPSSVTSYRYNGLGDRLEQTTGVLVTRFTMDLNSSLTQALSDGTNDYIYGAGRVAQVNASGTEYFLGDALGSVRQLTDATGAITLAKSYQPYGETTGSVGSGATSYGFTGEMTDPTGLVYLRARYYAPSTGKFLTRDLWTGDANRPMSYNSWLYTYNNPVNLSDPSGHDAWWCNDNPDPRQCGIALTPTMPVPTSLPPSTPIPTPSPRVLAPAQTIPQDPDANLPIPPQEFEYPAGSGHWYYNLCGQVSAEIVIEAITGRPYDIHNFFALRNKYTGTGNWELGELLAKSLGDNGQVYGYLGKGRYHYTGDENTDWANSGGSKGDWKNGSQKYAQDWWRGLDLLSTMSDWLSSGNYLIVAGVLDTLASQMASQPPQDYAGAQYVTHWVVVQTINGDNITIVNPYRNRVESYSWSGLFQASMGYVGNSLIRVIPK